MLKIDQVVKEQHLTVLDAFKIIDENDDEKITKMEFMKLFV